MVGEADCLYRCLVTIHTDAVLVLLEVHLLPVLAVGRDFEHAPSSDFRLAEVDVDGLQRIYLVELDSHVALALPLDHFIGRRYEYAVGLLT